MKASEKAAWRNFILSILSLSVAFVLAVYSDVTARAGQVLLTGIVGSLALLISGGVGVVWVPKLARRTSMEWLRASVDYHLTRAGIVYLAAIFTVAIAALNTGNNMLFLILAAMIAAIAVSGVVSRAVLTGLRVEVQLPEHVFARQAAMARVKLSNRKPVLPTFSVLVGAVQNSSVYFPFLKAHRDAVESVPITFPNRGVYKEDVVTLTSRFPFGFLEKVRKIPAAREMLVYPSVERGEGFYDILPQLTGEVETLQRGQGNDLYSIRDHQANDSARHVDWKSSARTGLLKVREFTREDELRVQLVFDRKLPDESSVARRRFEKGVDQCAALAWHFQELGAQVQFITSEGRSAFTPAGEIVYKILEYLARVQPGGSGVSLPDLDAGPETAVRIVLPL